MTRSRKSAILQAVFVVAHNAPLDRQEMRLLVAFWMMAGRADSGTACGRERHCGIGRVVLCADDCLYQDDADVQQSGYSKKGENESARLVFGFWVEAAVLTCQAGYEAVP